MRLIYRNPAKELCKAPVKRKRLELPKREEFTKVVNQVRKNGAWCSEQCGDLLSFWLIPAPGSKKPETFDGPTSRTILFGFTED